MKFSVYLLILIMPFFNSVFAFRSSSLCYNNNLKYRKNLHMTTQGSDIIRDVLQKTIRFLNNFPPQILGYFAVMLAPIYGIGLPGLGSMTDFKTVTNRFPYEGNEYMVAPTGYVPNAKPHEAKVYDISAIDLDAALTKVIKRSPRITFVKKDEITGSSEYIQRSLIFRFPDVITFKTIPIDKNKFEICLPEPSVECNSKGYSSVAIHSYSVYGAGDLGVNSNRVQTWLAELEKDLNDMVVATDTMTRTK